MRTFKGVHLIGVAGRSGSGKSTVAHYIKDKINEHGNLCIILPLAAELKRIARELGWNGKKDVGGRRLLQRLGTDIIRDCIDPEWHIKRWIHNFESILAQPKNDTIEYVIIDDVRFKNEASFIRDNGGKIIGIERDCVVKDIHSSETIDLYKNVDVIIHNNGTIDALYQAADRLVTVEKSEKPASKPLNELAEKVHLTAKEKGWWDGYFGDGVYSTGIDKKKAEKRIPEALANVHAEISEALEDYRDGNMSMTFAADGKPVGFPTEMADTIIRIIDLCCALGIDIDKAIAKKAEYNKTRAYRHGGKAA